MLPKQEVQQLLQQLPDTVSFDDIQYHIYVRQKIERGLEDVALGKTLTNEEFIKRREKWVKQ